jgi:hypothetical protein
MHEETMERSEDLREYEYLFGDLTWVIFESDACSMTIVHQSGESMILIEDEALAGRVIARMLEVGHRIVHELPGPGPCTLVLQDREGTSSNAVRSDRGPDSSE